MDSRLGRLQREVLDAFFRQRHGFYLTGGAALAGFHLGHRETDDLDLFALEDILDDGVATLGQVAREMGATLEAIKTAPDFRRELVRRGQEAVVVDLVRERVPQLRAEKPEIAGIRVDPPEEILANKLCALLSRAEIRDLVDVFALERAGFRIDDVFEAAQRKDGGLTPGQLAWVLSQIAIAEGAPVPGGLPPGELRAYLQDMITRLSRLSFPRRSSG